MPRKQSNRGTERYRDEKRAGGGPRYHAERWHDHPEPRVMEPETADLDALPEAEAAPERAGMGKHFTQRHAKGHSRLAQPEQPPRKPGAKR